MRVMQVGLGSIGIAVSRLLLQRPGWQLVAAVDTDAAKQGHDLGDLLESAHPYGIRVTDQLAGLREHNIDVAFLTTVSTLPEVLPTLRTLIESGINIVASTEELFYPYYRYADQAQELDELAKQHGVSILGTGINPGFAMDTLVLVLTSVCQRITRIAVTRVVNASIRRPLLLKRIGVGLTPETFAERLAEQAVGIASLVDSVAFLAHALQWPMDDVKERLVPVIADTPLSWAHGRLERGQVCGIRHMVKGLSQSKEGISLDVRIYLEAENARDTIHIEGVPSLDMTIKSTDMGDMAAANLLVNVSPLVHKARPGLLTMLDLPLPHFQR